MQPQHVKSDLPVKKIKMQTIANTPRTTSQPWPVEPVSMAAVVVVVAGADAIDGVDRVVVVAVASLMLGRVRVPGGTTLQP